MEKVRNADCLFMMTDVRPVRKLHSISMLYRL